MHNIRILKAAHHMNNCVYLTDICQELVPKSFPLTCSFYKTGNVYEFNNCRCHFLGMIHISKKFQTLIRYCYDKTRAEQSAAKPARRREMASAAAN